MALTESIRPTELQPNGVNPVMLLPGFTGPDHYLIPTREWLRGLHYHATVSHIGVNTGVVLRDIPLAEDHLDQQYDKYGEPVTLVGHSLGGLYARLLALRNPEKVHKVITVGSPTPDHMLGSINRALALGAHFYDRVSSAFHHFRDELQEELPPEIEEHHIFSDRDRIVRHEEHCEPDRYNHHRIRRGGHLSLMVNPLVLGTLSPLLKR